MRSSTNCLLQKGNVGRPAPSTFDLPKGDHAFGAANRPDAVDVRGRKYTWPNFDHCGRFSHYLKEFL